MNPFILISVEEIPAARSARRSEEPALEKARKQIAALQADNLRMRDLVAEEERELNAMRKSLNATRKAYQELLSATFM